MDDGELNYCRDIVRQQDPDRYVLAVLAPQTQRAALLSIYAFNAEISRIRESVSEPMLGQIRLQWWRDTIAALYAGQPHRHPLAVPLAAAIKQHDLSQANFMRLIDAREADLDPAPLATMGDLTDYAGGTAAPLSWLGLEICGVAGGAARDAGWNLGVAWALSGLIRALPFHLHRGWCYLPGDLLEKHQLDRNKLRAAGAKNDLKNLITEISQTIQARIRKSREFGRDIDRAAIPALRIAGFVHAYQRRLARFGYDPFDPRLAAPPPFIAWRLMLRGFIGRY
jgi:phytoene synthase